jgi:Glycosyltransferase family 17
VQRALLYENDDSAIHVGIVSQQPASFFDALRAAIDEDDMHERCARYGGYYYNNETHQPTTTTKRRRRLFLGANIATEPWEVLEVIGAEGYGLFAGIVYIESNRTQNFTPRHVRRLRHAPILAHLFGIPTSSVQVRLHVNEDEWSRDLIRENQQRRDIMQGWLDLGMTRDDVGIVADVDETFSRDFMLALQRCDGIPALDYERHHCHYHHVRITAAAQVFESSPECITAHRHWNRPNAILGHCIEGIADETLHPPAPRMGGRHRQAHGYGGDCDFSIVDNITDNRYPSWGPADFRDGCGPQTFVPFTCTIFLPNSTRRASSTKRTRTPFMIKPGAKFTTCTKT